MGDWYYIGHYGQLGPLTREQMDELIQGSVIAADTFVWRNGMTDWIRADRSPELASSFQQVTNFAAPPPPPSPAPATPPRTIGRAAPHLGSDQQIHPTTGYYPAFGGIRSDRSRLAAGILQLIIPGVGRMYLGYVAYGVLQLVLTVGTCGLLWLWSFIDGIIILSGGVKLDGYGRQLPD